VEEPAHSLQFLTGKIPYEIIINKDNTQGFFKGQVKMKNSTVSLMNLYANHRRTFIPFRLKREAAPDARCSILGAPPKGVCPARIDEKTRYFATLGLADGIDVSLFTTFDYQSEQSPFNFFAGTYKLYDQSSPLVQFVMHQRASERDATSALKHESPALGFVFGQLGTDPECPTIEALGNPAIYTDHKVGGQPCFSQLEGDIGAALALFHSGHVHLLQLNMPSAATDTLVRGMWVFGESVFHVFAKKLGNAFEFCYIWA
jgi:hypothetical protein